VGNPWFPPSPLLDCYAFLAARRRRGEASPGNGDAETAERRRRHVTRSSPAWRRNNSSASSVLGPGKIRPL